MEKRRLSQEVKVGKVKIGAAAPIVVQGMTKTDTEDILTSGSINGGRSKL